MDKTAIKKHIRSIRFKMGKKTLSKSDLQKIFQSLPLRTEPPKTERGFGTQSIGELL